MPCATVFVQGPDPFLKALDISVPCVVDPSKTAVLDPDHRRFVNYETFYFSTGDAMAAFDKDPVAYTGRLTDPVTRERFNPANAGAPTTIGNRLYYFASDSTAAVFAASTDQYATPRVGMIPLVTPESGN